jgi:hypothetical protein
VLVWPCGGCEHEHLERLSCVLIRDGCERVLVPMGNKLMRYVEHAKTA